MAILNGLKQDSYLAQPLTDRTYLSPNVITVTDSTFDPNSSRLEEPNTGVALRNIVTPGGTIYQGIKTESVNSFLYDRYVRQDGDERQDGIILDVGVINDSQTITQSLWNGFDETVEIQSIGFSYPTSGVTIIAPILTEEFQFYEERPLEIFIDISGEQFFDVDITITYDNSETYVFTVRGTRQPLKEFTYLSPANWKGGLAIETQYLTSIYQAAETSETRQALRVDPVRLMKYEFAAVGESFSTVLWGFLQSLAKRRTYLPLFQDGTVTTQDNVGVRIFCDTTYRRFYAGDTLLIVLRRFDRSHDAGTNTDEAMYYPAIISAVSDTFIDLTALPDGLTEVPQGSIVYPGIFSEIAVKKNVFSVFKTTGSIVTVEINEVFGSTTIRATNSSYSPTLFYDQAFLDIPINWNVRPKVGVGRDVVSLKGGRYKTIIAKSGFSTASIDIIISVHNRPDWWELSGFLNYIKGRLRAFWIKHPLEAYILGDYTLFSGPDVTEVEVLTQGGINNTYSLQAVWVKSSTDEEKIIKVDAIRAGFTSSSIILELDPTTITDIVEIRRAFLVRNISDKVKEQWYRDDGVVEVKLKTQELPAGYA